MILILALSLISIYLGLITFIIISCLCFIKERFLDTYFDKEDLIAGLLGGSSAVLFVIIVRLISNLI